MEQKRKHKKKWKRKDQKWNIEWTSLCQLLSASLCFFQPLSVSLGQTLCIAQPLNVELKPCSTARVHSKKRGGGEICTFDLDHEINVLSISITVYPSVYLSIYEYVYPSTHSNIHLYLHPSIYISIPLSICQSTHPIICTSIELTPNQPCMYGRRLSWLTKTMRNGEKIKSLVN